MTDQSAYGPAVKIPQLPPIPIPPPPTTVLEAAERIQRAAAELKAVIPWLETPSARLGYWQRYWTVIAHQALNVVGCTLEISVFGQADGTFFAGGGGPKP
jgi:hypothetical protein